MLPLLDRRGAEYPAEHNVGHLYHAKPALAAHYRALAPQHVQPRHRPHPTAMPPPPPAA
jgi:D-lactate dehydrogenase